MQPTRYSPPASHTLNVGRHGGVINLLNANNAVFETCVSERDRFAVNSAKLHQASHLPQLVGSVGFYVKPADVQLLAAIDKAGHDARVIS